MALRCPVLDPNIAVYGFVPVLLHLKGFSLNINHVLAVGSVSLQMVNVI